MKIAIANEHKEFFRKHGWIEFNDFFTQDQIFLCNKHIKDSLVSRLKTIPEAISQKSSCELFSAGRDLWRESTNLLKFISQPKLAQISSELLDKRPLRLAYDQFYPDINSKQSVQKDLSYSKFLDQNVSLEDVSSIKGILCGVMIGLSPAIEKIDIPPAESEGMDIFPNGLGHVLFFLPDRKIDFKKYFLHPEQKYLLIVYAQSTSFYQPQLTDPQAYFIKQYGYDRNDKLTQQFHPIIYR